MRCFHTFRPRVLVALTALSFVAGVISTDDAQGQDSKPAQSLSKTTAGQYDDGHSPQLGVLVASCPGKGVCVTSTIWGSPASYADIQAGDYILSVNSQEVSSPEQLKTIIENLKVDDKVKLVVWRRGEELTKEVSLAAEAQTLPESRKAWIGVMLTDGDGQQPDAQGVVIAEVQRRSPAERAGLATGDVIVKMDGEKVESIDQFVAKVGDFAPGDQVPMTIRRDEQEKEITVEVGTVTNAPLQWLRRSMQGPRIQAPRIPGGRPGQMLPDPMLRPMTDMEFALPPFPTMPSNELSDELIDEMREQIRELRKDIETLKQEQEQEQEQNDSQNEDLSLDTSFSHDAFVRLVAEPQKPQEGTWRDFGHNRRNPPSANRGPANLPHLSNDWTGERYRYYNRPSRDYGNQYHFYNPYPYYYPYHYYQHRGRPYYYGGGYPYGYRGGVQLGPNFGIYW